MSVKIVGLKKLQDLRVKYKNHVNHVEVSLKYDYPKNAGWFIEEKPTIKWMMVAGLPMDWKPKTLCKPQASDFVQAAKLYKSPST